MIDHFSERVRLHHYQILEVAGSEYLYTFLLSCIITLGPVIGIKTFGK